MATSTDPGERDTSLRIDLTLNEILARRPDAGALLNRLGFDTCCGGARTLAEAARALDLDPAEILDRLGNPSPLSASRSPCGCGAEGNPSGRCD
jgi:iron-sulfur cluster repair protein YtfE (RIC family)